MVRVWGLNIPAELAKDVHHFFSHRRLPHFDHLGRHRRTGGPPTGRRLKGQSAFRTALQCWHVQTREDRLRWRIRAKEAGWERYFNYFMSITNYFFRFGLVPNWCKALGPAGPMVEVKNTNFSHVTQIDNLPAVHGDRIKITYLVCASELFPGAPVGESYEPRDSLYVNVILASAPEEEEPHSFLTLYAMVLGEDHCRGWQETILHPTPYAEQRWKQGFFKDLRWHVVEQEATVMFPRQNMTRWYINMGVFLKKSLPVQSNGVVWLNWVTVFLNDIPVWELNLGKAPETDPEPKETGWSIIKANIAPWERWSRPAPECTGKEEWGI